MSKQDPRGVAMWELSSGLTQGSSANGQEPWAQIKSNYGLRTAQYTINLIWSIKSHSCVILVFFYKKDRQWCTISSMMTRTPPTNWLDRRGSIISIKLCLCAILVGLLEFKLYKFSPLFSFLALDWIARDIIEIVL